MLLPAKLVGCPGVTTAYVEGGRFSSSGYQYRTKFDVAVTEPLTAIEFRFLTFDLWGERGKSLVMTKIQDFPPGETSLSGEWQIFSENEASAFYASIAYVSRVRTKEGKIITADILPVVEEAKKLYAKFSESDLDPEKPTKTGK